MNGGLSPRLSGPLSQLLDANNRSRVFCAIDTFWFRLDRQTDVTWKQLGSTSVQVTLDRRFNVFVGKVPLHPGPFSVPLVISEGGLLEIAFDPNVAKALWTVVVARFMRGDEPDGWTIVR